jgi:hypothetical protein
MDDLEVEMDDISREQVNSKVSSDFPEFMFVFAENVD